MWLAGAAPVPHRTARARHHDIWGFARLRLLAGGGRTPRATSWETGNRGVARRHSWGPAAPLGRASRCEIAECARLIKGYDATPTSAAATTTAASRPVELALWAAWPRAAADAVANARVAALADPEGQSLGRTLAAIALASPPLRAAAEWKKCAATPEALMQVTCSRAASASSWSRRGSAGGDAVTAEPVNFNGLGHGGLTFMLCMWSSHGQAVASTCTWSTPSRRGRVM